MDDTTFNCEGSPKPRPSSKTACDYQKDLKDSKAASQSKFNASKALKKGLKLTKGYKLCTLEQTQITQEYYRDLDNYELLDMQRSTERIAKDIEGYIKKDGDLDKLIKEAAKKIIELKGKLHEANNAACAMRNCLKSVLDFKDEAPPALKSVTDQAKLLSEHSQMAAEAIRNIAGIHTFAGMGSLKGYSEELVTSVKELKATTDIYSKAANDQLKGAQAELSAVIEKLSAEKLNYLEEKSLFAGLGKTSEFICKGTCPTPASIEKIIEDICQEVSAPPSDGGADPCKDKHARHGNPDAN